MGAKYDCALRGNHAAHFHILVSIRALSGASRRQDFGSAPLQSYLEGGIPDTDGNAALVLFRGTQGGHVNFNEERDNKK